MVRAGQLLRKFCDLADDNEWNDLIVNHFEGSERTVQRYMYLAKHWSLLEAAAPPEALTSQRKALALIRTLLYGEEPTAPAGDTRRKRRAAALIEVNSSTAGADASSCSTQAAASGVPPARDEGEDKPRIAVQRMYDDIQRVLGDLTEQLTILTPTNHLVRHALDAIRRSRNALAKRARSLFTVPASAADDAERTDSAAPSACARARRSRATRTTRYKVFAYNKLRRNDKRVLNGRRHA